MGTGPRKKCADWRRHGLHLHIALAMNIGITPDAYAALQGHHGSPAVLEVAQLAAPRRFIMALSASLLTVVK